MTADVDRAARRRELLREIEQLRSLRARLAPGRVRRQRLERLHLLTRLSA